jgi:hypothetical protein
MVPEQLKELHEEKCLEICKLFLDSCGAKGDNFLERIVTEDETWIHHYEPESKCQGMKWKYPHSPAKRKFKTHPTAGNLMLTVFWDSQRLLLEHFQETVEQCTVLATVAHFVTS